MGVWVPTMRMVNFLWIMMGALALSLGALGLVLPVLPTTPFVLLAAFCFGKGSPAWHERLLNNNRFGPFIRSWEEWGAIPRGAKLLAAAMMAGAMAASLLADLDTSILLIQAVCLSLAAVYVFSRPDA